MSEMTDNEVQERLAKYRRGRKIRRIGGWFAGIVAACLVIVGIGFGARAVAGDGTPVDPMETKPLVEWTDQEKAERAELYADRLAKEPIEWKNLLKTGFCAPGKIVVHGKVLRNTLWLLVASVAVSILLHLLLALPVLTAVKSLISVLWRIWIFFDGLLSLWIALLLVSLLWRAFLA